MVKEKAGTSADPAKSAAKSSGGSKKIPHDSRSSIGLAKSSSGANSRTESVKASAEIDDLFNTAKIKKKLRKEKEGEETSAPKPRKSKKKSDEEDINRPYGIMNSANGVVIVNPEAPLERIDAESGLPVYKAHLLKVGEGGGTPLCPFDCNCCF